MVNLPSGDCSLRDLSSHSFQQGVCIRCLKTPLHLAALSLVASCQHQIDPSTDGESAKCQNCGVVLADLRGEVALDRVVAQAVRRWFGRDNPDLPSLVLALTLAELNLGAIGDGAKLKMLTDLAKFIDRLSVESDPFSHGRAFMIGLLLYAQRHAELVVRSLGPGEGRKKTGTVVSRTTVGVSDRNPRGKK